MTIALLLANLLILLYVAFGKKSNPEAHGAGQPTLPKENTNPPNRLIHLDSALQIIKNYEPRRTLHTSLLPQGTIRNHGDTKSVFTEFQDFKSYIKYIEELSQAKNIPVDGLRFYFGAYPENASSEKSGMQTLVIFPTTSVGNKKSHGVDLESSGLQSPKLIQDLLSLNELNIAKGTTLKTNGVGSSGYNDMNSSPPRQPVG